VPAEFIRAVGLGLTALSRLRASGDSAGEKSPWI
jgi:hypothetical protein